MWAASSCHCSRRADPAQGPAAQSRLSKPPVALPLPLLSLLYATSILPIPLTTNPATIDLCFTENSFTLMGYFPFQSKAAKKDGAAPEKGSSSAGATANDFDASDDPGAHGSFDYDLVVVGGGSGGIAAAKVTLDFKNFFG